MAASARQRRAAVRVEGSEVTIVRVGTGQFYEARKKKTGTIHRLADRLDGPPIASMAQTAADAVAQR